VQWDPSFSLRTDGQKYGRTDRRTDRYDEVNSHSSQFCNFSNAPKNFSVHANAQISPVRFRNSISIKEMPIKIAVPASQQTKCEPQRQTTMCFIGCV